jgi:AraC-like DNA-binding protein
MGNAPSGDADHPWPLLSASTALRRATWTSHCQAVERVILAMRECPGDLFTLESMAQIALFSLYHFSRIFRLVTGVSPHRFLAALRMQAAKTLLLTTGLRVTDICFEVGYNSLGTFTSQFNQQVGVSPTGLRRLKWEAAAPLDGLCNGEGPRERGAPRSRLCGTVTSRRGLHVAGPVFVGLFPGPLPQGKPAACSFMGGPGTYRMPAAPDGRYYLMAAALPWSDDLISYLLPDESKLQVGRSEAPVLLQGARTSGSTDLVLRPVRITDPPIVSALPVLLAGSTTSAALETAP